MKKFLFFSLWVSLIFARAVSLNKTQKDVSTMTEILWNFDNLDAVGGNRITVLGSPRVIDTPKGKATEFDGKQDGLLVNDLPLTGFDQFTVEVIFRPDADGLKEQRFFHMQESASQNRVLLETRLIGNSRWFLDTYIRSGQTDKTLFAENFTHPVGQWYEVALVFDGREMRHYVNGTKELASEISFIPLHQGQTSIGVRINRVYWFKGAIRKARFAPRALMPEEFLQP